MPFIMTERVHLYQVYYNPIEKATYATYDKSPYIIAKDIEGAIKTARALDPSLEHIGEVKFILTIDGVQDGT